MTIRDFAGDDYTDPIPTMPWGRYEGRKVNGLPDLYLRWLSTLDSLPEAVQAAVAAECDRRRRAEDARRPAGGGWTIAESIIATGVRTLALKWGCHPDVGGTHEQMVALNETADRMRRLISRAGLTR